MARPIRVEFEGAAYHVTSRGNEQKEIFHDDIDRRRFLETLGQCCQRFGLVVQAYCLMPNHYHLLVQTPRANLSRAIGWLQTTYCMRFNRRHRRCGHLVQGRFKAHLIDADAYARQLVRYVHLNPVRLALLGLSKSRQHVIRQSLSQRPDREHRYPSARRARLPGCGIQSRRNKSSLPNEK